MTMRPWIVVGALCVPIMVASGAYGESAPSVTKSWELAGFKQPESVVYEPGEGVLYVSNVDGSPTEKDGQGFISRVSLEGRMLDEKWVDGLNAPKGLAVSGGKLYVADIDALVEIDLADKTTARYEAEGAKFFNDVTADGAGRVYVADTFTNAIWRLDGGSFTHWLSDPDLAAPNGLLAEDGQLVVTPLGEVAEGGEGRNAEHLRTVSLAHKSVASLGDRTPIGNLDGLQPDGKGNYFVTDWVSGGLFHVRPSGAATKLLALNAGSADLEYVESAGLIVIPMMNDGQLVAYRVE
jgi:sugar lactone lactonase YvrE